MVLERANATAGDAAQSLKIVHVFRAPVGGLFRHVVDLARGQTARGHRVGLIADLTTGGARAEAVLAELAGKIALGILRTPMSRHIGARDVACVRVVGRHAAALGADVLHGHGAKGGAYARLAGVRALKVYTPHGGSLHYGWGSPIGLFYLAAERALMRRTDLFLFESAYSRDIFTRKIGVPKALVRVVHNGVTRAEFSPVEPDPDASDLLFVGELRALKGVDVLIDALALLDARGRTMTLTIVGDGPDGDAFRARSAARGLSAAIRFAGVLPARQAFARGRILIVPSRAESLPYIVLEAGAAGLPLIATRVGGMTEIFGDDSVRLVTPDDAPALARAILAAMDDAAARTAAAQRLRERIGAAFSADTMTDGVLSGYRDATAASVNDSSGRSAQD